MIPSQNLALQLCVVAMLSPTQCAHLVICQTITVPAESIVL